MTEAYSQTQAMNDVTMNDHNDNEYQMKKNSRVTKPENWHEKGVGVSNRLRREWSVEWEHFEFRMEQRWR